MILEIAMTIILSQSRCRVVWTDYAGKNHYGKWMDCKAAQAWADLGNRDYPQLKHRVEKKN